MNARDWIEELRQREQLPRDYLFTFRDHVIPLGERISDLRRQKPRGVVVGICGAQGSGKSTLSLFLERWLRREAGLAVATLSLDDLYFGKQTREQLGLAIHPLFETRGVPGTHDTALGSDILRSLISGDAVVAIPVFDKAGDDRVARPEWREITAPVDVVLFEGWCVGARPQSTEALSEPVNDLEAGEDPDGSWRRRVNDCLSGDYADLFGWLDVLAFMRVPSFDKVLEWRTLQEIKLVGHADEQSMLRFLAFFERLTRHMQETLPDLANALIDVDDSHRISRIVYRDWPSP
ncbi:MAG: hypothetical protein GWN47_03135 [Woeseiaceae bacterium]|nr:hypothetical protein [Woeseiaceae bacterium]